MNIEEALERVHQYDEEAFAFLYDASYARVYRFVLYRALDIPFTEDIVSEIYLKVYKNIHTLHARSQGEFFSWIFRVAYTTFLDAFRAKKHTQSLDTIPEKALAYQMSEHIDNQEQINKILLYLQKFPQRDKNILLMRIWDNLTYKEIATITGERVENCKQIVSRGLKKIAANC